MPKPGLEPGTLLGIVPRRHAADQLGLVGTALLPGGSSPNGRTRVHSGKGLVLLALLAVAANDPSLKAVKLAAVFGKGKIGRQVLSQEGRAVALRNGGLIRALSSEIDSCCNGVSHDDGYKVFFSTGRIMKVLDGCLEVKDFPSRLTMPRCTVHSL